MLIKFIKEYLKRFKFFKQFSDSKRRQKVIMNKIHDFKILEGLDNNTNECYQEKKELENLKDFFKQKILLLDLFDRLNLFEYYCKGKKVLHIGCVDYPIFNPANNLHIILSKLTSELHGLDLDIKGMENLKQYVDQPYFSQTTDVTGSYDICLIPEVVEHVDNISIFLKNVEKINAKIFIFTAPNAIVNFHRSQQSLKTGQVAFEYVHPDHNYYFSPYTLKNVIFKYSSLKVNNVFLFGNQNSVCCVCSRNMLSN